MGLNYEAVLLEELVSAYQREWLWHITVIPCPLVVCLICTPSVLGQTTGAHVTTVMYYLFIARKPT